MSMSVPGNADFSNHGDGSQYNAHRDQHKNTGGTQLVRPRFTVQGDVNIGQGVPPKSSVTPFCTIRFPRDRDFVARKKLLEDLHQKYSLRASSAALVGFGGVGKSQLAIEYCYQVHKKTPETWIFWVHASSSARFEESYRDIADFVKIDGRVDRDADIFRLVYNWLRDPNNGRWLLVIDNLDDVSWIPETRTTRTESVVLGRRPNDKFTKHLWNYLPQSENGLVLVTTRTESIARDLVDRRDIIHVDPMDEEQAVDLFEKKLSEASDRAAVVELVTELEFMPLAVVQAAAYIDNQIGDEITPYSIQNYIAELQTDRRKMELLADEVGHHLRRDRDALNSITMTWQISFNHIQQQRPSAANLLSLMSFFDRQRIQKHLLSRLDETQNQNMTEDNITAKLDKDLSTLKHYSFLSVNNDSSTFGMHRLVQLATQKWLEDHGQLEKWKQQYIKILCAEFPSGEYENWHKCRPIFPHVKLALAQQPEEDDSLVEWALLLHNAAWYALLGGNARDAEEMSVKSMKVRMKQFGQNDEMTLDTQQMVASTYRNQGRLKEAEEIQVQVLEISKRVLGLDHPDTLTSMGRLASTYRNQGRLKESEELEVQVLEMSKRALSQDHPDTLTSMGNLASTYRNQGRLKEAEELEVQVLEIRKKVLGLDHPGTLNSMNNLALTYSNQGRLKEAEELEVQVLAIRKKVLGLDHPDTLNSMNNLALTYWNQGQLEEAEELEVQVLAIRKTAMGQDHPGTLISMNNLAWTWKSQNRDAEALELLSLCLELSKNKLGPDHPDTLYRIKTYNSWKMD